jgi:hypothetical protein
MSGRPARRGHGRTAESLGTSLAPPDGRIDQRQCWEVGHRSRGVRVVRAHPRIGQIEPRERSSPPLAAFAVSTSAVIAPQSGSLSQAGEPPPRRSGRSIARRLGRKSHPPTIRGEKRAFFCTNAWLTAASSRPVGRSAGFVGLGGATRGFPVGRSGHYY